MVAMLLAQSYPLRASPASHRGCPDLTQRLKPCRKQSDALDLNRLERQVERQGDEPDRGPDNSVDVSVLGAMVGRGAALGSWRRTCSPGILVGAWVGAAWATRMRSATQYRVLAVLLDAIAGVLIGVLAALMGAAGAELLIPTIVLLSGVDFKIAGSLLLAVSLPTMLVAFSATSRNSSSGSCGRTSGSCWRCRAGRSPAPWSGAGAGCGAECGAGCGAECGADSGAGGAALGVFGEGLAARVAGRRGYSTPRRPPECSATHGAPASP